MTSTSDEALVEDPDALPPPPPELLETSEKDLLDSALEGPSGASSTSHGASQGASYGDGSRTMLEGLATLPRHRHNNHASSGHSSHHHGPSSFHLLGPQDFSRGTRAVLTTSSLDRRLVARPRSLVNNSEANPWVPIPPPRNIVPTPSTTTENGHVVSSDDDQVSPTEDMLIGRPVNGSQSTQSEPTDVDHTDPSITW